MLGEFPWMVHRRFFAAGSRRAHLQRSSMVCGEGAPALQEIALNVMMDDDEQFMAHV